MRLTLNPSSPADYETFLKVKRLPAYRVVGRDVEFPDEYSEALGLGVRPVTSGAYVPLRGLFDYQRAISALAIRKRKFAAFVEPGLGKTLIECEFARHAALVLPPEKCVLMITPLMVVPQFMEEIARFYGAGMPVEVVAARDLAKWLKSGAGRIGLTNWEALRAGLEPGRLGGLVVDESSYLKSMYGKWGQVLLGLGRGIEWKLCGTGTPAPNDRIEYANHAVFLDHFPTANSFLARFFVNRGQTDNRWELKAHALRPFYTALSHWCIFLSNPATYGWRDNAGTLPPIRIHYHPVGLTEGQREIVRGLTGGLFGTEIETGGGIATRATYGQIAKGRYKGEAVDTLKPAAVAGLVRQWPSESTIVWCKFNAEQDTIERALPEAHSMRGDTPHERRREMLADFRAGRVKTLISKADLLGFGLNLQVTTRMVFSTLMDSYEEFWQCLKRGNRVGSDRPLDVHIPLTDLERPMVENVMRKAARVQADTEEQERLFKEVGHVAFQ